MAERTLTPQQREWCKKYKEETTFDPLIDDFLAGEETFKEAAQKSVEWFEDWANDVTLAIGRYTFAEDE